MFPDNGRYALKHLQSPFQSIWFAVNSLNQEQHIGDNALLFFNVQLIWFMFIPLVLLVGFIPFHEKLYPMINDIFDDDLYNNFLHLPLTLHLPDSI